MELVKKMLLQEVQQSDTRTDGDGNMLLNNEYRSQPVLDDFQNESAATRIKASSFPDELDLGKGQRTKKMTKKGLEYQISLMKEKSQMYPRLFRKCDVVEDLL